MDTDSIGAMGPNETAVASGRVVADTAGLRRAADAIDILHSSLPTDRVDASLLSAEELGHAGVADALAAFAHGWGARMTEYGQHLTAMGDTLAATAAGYEATDGAAAGEVIAAGAPDRPVDTAPAETPR